MTFSEFVTAVSRQVWPQGEAPNLKAVHKNWVKDALIKLQQRVLCQQAKQYDFIPQAATFWNCGCTVFEAPRGFILGLKTIDMVDSCDEVRYTPTTKEEIECLVREDQGDSLTGCGCYGSQPEPYAYCGPYLDYGYTLGMRYANLSNDQNCRARSGVFALHDGFIWTFPAIRSDEIAVLEWRGIKREWNNADIVTDDREVQEAVELYLEFRAASKEDCDPQKLAVNKNLFDDKIGDLIHQCRKELRLPQPAPCFYNCNVCHHCSGKPAPGPNCTGSAYYYGAVDPNGVQDGNVGDIYIQIDTNGQAFQWINSTGGINGWV